MNFPTDNGKLSTRQVILEAIKQSREATVEELALAADVSPVTVRHHLNSLQADGLLETRSVRRKVGRPYFVYSLSEDGQELFPKRYVRLSSRLIEELKLRFPSEMVAEVFAGVVEQIVEEHRPRLEKLDFEGRLDYLVRLLGEEGFLASWQLTDEGYQVTEHNCPYFSIGQKHHEICTFDRQLIQIVMDTEVAHHTCMLDGDSCCQFTIPASAAAG